MPLSALASTDPNGPSSPDALRVQGSTRATVARALKGETAATPSPTWPSDWRRTVYNLVFRFTGNRKCAKSVTRLMDPVSKRIPKDGRPFIHIARDLLEGDRANDGGVTPAIFHGPQLITAEMPQELRGILGDQEEACINKNEIKGNLEPAILGVLELTFIDDRPMHEVAALLDLTPGLLLTFLISLFDHLGDIASLDDRACDSSHHECPHFIDLVRRVIEDSQPDDATMSCPRCKSILDRSIGIRTFFRIESRIISLGDAAMASPVRSRTAARPNAKAQERAAREWRQQFRFRAARGTVGLAILAAAALMIPFGGSRGRMHRVAGLDVGTGNELSTQIGTLVTPGAPDQVIMSGTSIRARDQSIRLNLDRGIRVVLGQRGAVEVHARGLTLREGHLEVEQVKDLLQPLFLRAGLYEGRLFAGAIRVDATDPDNPIFKVQSGVLEIVEPDNTRHRVPEGGTWTPVS